MYNETLLLETFGSLLPHVLIYEILLEKLPIGKSHSNTNITRGGGRGGCIICE